MTTKKRQTMTPEQLRRGDHVSWHTAGGEPATVRIAYAGRDRIGYDSRDGYPGYWEATRWHSLAAALPRTLRSATGEETAAYAAAAKTYIIGYH